MKLLFAGTPEIAVPTLSRLARGAHPVVGVLTAPDRPMGRGRTLTPSPVKAAALDSGLPVFEFDRLGTEARDSVRGLGAELLVCVAYGRIFGPRFLALFAHGGINLHPSLLPKYRGPAPIPAAILAGDKATGLTVQMLAREMDAGDILAQETIELDGSETTGSLTTVAAERGAGLVATVVDRIASASITPVPQCHEDATYTSLIQKADGHIIWTHSAAGIERQVRAYQPWPLAFTVFAGQRLNILEAHVAGVAGEGGTEKNRPGAVLRVDNAHGILVETGNGLLAVTRLQLQSRKALTWDQFLNGVKDFVGAVLGD